METPTAPATASTTGAPADGLPGAPADGSPGAPSVRDEDIIQAHVEAIDARLDEVEASLARIDAGSYGRCEECGALIDDAVLAGRPTATRCGTCPPPEPDGGPTAVAGTYLRS